MRFLKVDFEPKSNDFVSINNMTKVIVEPYTDPDFSTKVDGSIKTERILSKQWSSTFHVVYFDSDEPTGCETECSASLKCTHLTRAELVYQGSHLSSSEKYLISIEALESPIQVQYRKESASSPMKKFLNSISSSYSTSYLDRKSGGNKIWALMMGFGEISHLKKPRLKLSRFLGRQLRMFEIKPKVLVKAELVNEEIEQKILSMASKKSIKLRTSFKNDVSVQKQHQYNFIVLIFFE